MEVGLEIYLTLSRRRPLSYRNQSIDLRSKSMDWFQYGNGLCLERVKGIRRQSQLAGKRKQRETTICEKIINEDVSIQKSKTYQAGRRHLFDMEVYAFYLCLLLFL